MRRTTRFGLLATTFVVSISCSAPGPVMPAASVDGALTDAPISRLSRSQSTAPSEREMDAGPMNSAPFSGETMPMSTGNNGHQHSAGASGQGGHQHAEARSLD